MSKEFSIEETENLIANFQSDNSPLANYLNQLSDVTKIKLPPVPPSLDGYESNVRGLRSARKGMTIFAIEAALIATAVASAAALSGFGPEPVVNFVKSTAESVTKTVEKVASLVTGGDTNSPSDPEPEVSAPAPDPSETPSATASEPSSETPTKSATPTPSAKADPKPSLTPSPESTKKQETNGIGVPAPTKKADNDDEDNESDNEGGDDGELQPVESKKPSESIKSPSASISNDDNKNNNEDKEDEEGDEGDD